MLLPPPTHAPFPPPTHTHNTRHTTHARAFVREESLTTPGPQNPPEAFLNQVQGGALCAKQVKVGSRRSRPGGVALSNPEGLSAT